MHSTERTIRDAYDDCPISKHEFRVLTIYPSNKRRSPLEGQLEFVRLDARACERYATLSYAWDDRNVYRWIKLNGAAFRVSRTVDRALRHIRALNVHRVWIDQICIHQTNVQERNQQVSYMDKIYAGGIECFVYLGEGTGRYGDVDWLIRFVKQARRLRKDWNPLKYIDQRKLRTFFDCEVRDGERCPWQCCIDYIMQQLYFTRTWVLQELYFSKKVTCLIGTEELPWHVVKALATEIPLTVGLASNKAAERQLFRHHQNSPEFDVWKALWAPIESNTTSSKARSLTDFSNFINLIDTAKDCDLLSLLKLARGLQTTDPRDKVFALRNIASDGAEFPQPDYFLDTQEVYKLYAESLVRKGYATEVLSLTHLGQRHVSGASWVPRWDLPSPEFNFELDTRFNAGGNRVSPCSWSLNNPQMKAHCYSHVAFRSSSLCNASPLFKQLASFVDDFADNLPCNPTEVKSLIDCLFLGDSLMNLLFCDPIAHGPHVFRQKSMFDQRHVWEALVEALKKTHNNLVHDVVTLGPTKSYNKHVLRAWRGSNGEQKRNHTESRNKFQDFTNKTLNISRTESNLRATAPALISSRGEAYINDLRAEMAPLCIIILEAPEGEVTEGETSEGGTSEGETSRGRGIGFAPATCTAGDKVMIVRGARAPYIFRECGPNQYKNLGQAYIRGIMNGEVVEKLGREDFEYVEIV